MTDSRAAERRVYADVYRFVRRRTRPDDAEDLTQEVFEDAAVALAAARLHAPPTLAWLYTVARRRLIDLGRRRTLDVVPLDTVVEPAQRDATYGPAIVGALTEALAQLTDGQRRVVLLKVFEGRTFAQIAGSLGTSEEAARMRFARGLARLREELEQKGVVP